MSPNKLVNTDAQGRPLGRYAPCAPLRGRGLHARYVAWVQCTEKELPQSPGRARQSAAVAGRHLARRGAFGTVGARVSWYARESSASPVWSLSNSCSLREATPPVPGMHLVGATTAAHNTPVNTDAQGRPLGRYAPCAPLR